MPPVPKDEGEEEENPYMALRAAKIARNQAQLKKLGLVKPTPVVGSSISIPPTNTNTKRSKKTSLSSAPAVLRRSSRLSNQPDQPDYKEKALPREYSLPSSPPKKRPRTSSLATTPAPPPPANSVRSVDLNIEQLVLGNSTDKEGHGLLGHQMERTGKEFVIYQAFERASSSQDRDRLEGSRLSFNKYCGVQEWRNSIFLWVNLGNKDNPVVNDFLDNAQQITWFGGSRMHDESPVILKLLKLGKEATSTKNQASNIVLWCRKYQTETKQFTPYVCFGRLGYESHEPGSHPLSFVWNLLDYQGFKNHADKEIRDRFQYFASS